MCKHYCLKLDFSSAIIRRDYAIFKLFPTHKPDIKGAFTKNWTAARTGWIQEIGR